MKIGYGITVQEFDDPYISIAEEALNGAAQAGTPGAFWVDFLPILKYVPNWFPGAGFQKKAACWREALNTMLEKPFLHVQEQLVQAHFLRANKLLFDIDFYRKMAELRRLQWQQASLGAFLRKEILNGPGKKWLRKVW